MLKEVDWSSVQPHPDMDQAKQILVDQGKIPADAQLFSVVGILWLDGVDKITRASMRLVDPHSIGLWKGNASAIHPLMSYVGSDASMSKVHLKLIVLVVFLRKY
jgi:hypothetical protein